jgi:hypothetical protein
MGGGKGKGGKDKGMGPRGRCAFKVLCPDALVKAILGPRGTYKDQMQEESGCKLVFSNRDEYFPGTHFRILVIYGPSPEAVGSIIDKILEHLVTLGNEEQQSRPSGEPDFLGKESGEYCLRSIIGLQTTPGLIGAKGANLQAIRQECNAKVFIDNDKSYEHQVMRIIAGVDGLHKAVQKINEYVQQSCEESWFPEWAMIRTFPEHVPPANSRWEGERERSPRRATSSWAPGPAVVPPRGRAPVQQSSEDSRLQAMSATVQEMYPETLDAEFTIECVLEPRKVSALIGKKGEHVKSVRQMTGTNIVFGEVDQDDSQKMTVKGPLFGIYRAHAMLMKRYHEHGKPPPEPEKANVEDLYAQLDSLQRQISEVQAKQTRTKGKGKGKS